MRPAAVGETYWQLYQQPRDAWTFEHGNPSLRREVVGSSAMELAFPRRCRVPRRGPRLHRGELSAEMRVPNPETDLTKEQMLLWHRILHRKGWIAPLWPKAIWRARLVDYPALHLRAGDDARRHAAAIGLQRHHGRPGDLHLRQRGAEEAVPAANSFGRGLVVPGLFRAGLRLGPRLGPHQGGARRRPLHRQRPEDLDHAGAARRLGLLPGPHRSRTRNRRPASASC